MGMQPARKWDMFDVAKGDCELMDFLLVRYNPLDLQTRILLDPKQPVQEIMAPKPPEPEPAPAPLPAEPQLVISAEDEFVKPGAESVGSAETFTASEKPAEDGAAAPAANPMDPDELQKLIASFHQAAQQYSESSQWKNGEAPETPEE